MAKGDLLVEGLACVPVLKKMNLCCFKSGQEPSIYIFKGCVSDVMHPNVLVSHLFRLSFCRNNICLSKGKCSSPENEQ